MHAEEAEMKHQVQLLHSRAMKATVNDGYPASEQVPHNVEESAPDSVHSLALMALCGKDGILADKKPGKLVVLKEVQKII